MLLQAKIHAHLTTGRPYERFATWCASSDCLGYTNNRRWGSEVERREIGFLDILAKTRWI